MHSGGSETPRVKGEGHEVKGMDCCDLKVAVTYIFLTSPLIFDDSGGSETPRVKCKGHEVMGRGCCDLKIAVTYIF